MRVEVVHKFNTDVHNNVKSIRTCMTSEGFIITLTLKNEDCAEYVINKGQHWALYVD